ncbi:unnamed protein product [Caenorhabditis auriculariae]|uniref:Uncharacterized protein n=1 Tax=Caenorhabditis auriculariae TaxID=2777116 RepID=A0A8S1H5W5_9PELO|nr:unnamed protein product [Caenorhabditis auriculariae]
MFETPSISAKYPWIARARCTILLELLLSLIFDIAMIESVIRGQLMNLLLVIILSLNVFASVRLLMKLRGANCASSITAYVAWKAFQEIIMVPVLVVFTFFVVDKYIKSWMSSEKAVQVLVVAWLYACYSLFIILDLGSLARALWKRKEKERRQAETISCISDAYEELSGRREISAYSQMRTSQEDGFDPEPLISPIEQSSKKKKSKKRNFSNSYSNSLEMKGLEA